MNENDAIATDEITFGDNDVLAAQVADLVGARQPCCSRSTGVSTRGRRERLGPSCCRGATRAPRELDVGSSLGSAAGWKQGPGGPARRLRRHPDRDRRRHGRRRARSDRRGRKAARHALPRCQAGSGSADELPASLRQAVSRRNDHGPRRRQRAPSSPARACSPVGVVERSAPVPRRRRCRAARAKTASRSHAGDRCGWSMPRSSAGRPANVLEAVHRDRLVLLLSRFSRRGRAPP